MNKDIYIISGVRPKNLGAALAKILITNGAEVIISARTEKNLQEVSDEISSDRLHILAGDITEGSYEVALVKKAEELGGIIQGIVFAATEYSPVSQLLQETDAADLEKNFKVNVLGPHALIKSLFSLLSNDATLVFLSSYGGLVVAALPGNVKYNVAKGAMNLLTRTLDLEFIQAGSERKALFICPGRILTPLTDDWLKNNPHEMEVTLTAQEAAENIINLLQSGSFPTTGYTLDKKSGIQPIKNTPREVPPLM
jgi:NAD(P)-dependent dehydrogenase (short-subunit alcohol dehydrogenase family)